MIHPNSNGLSRSAGLLLHVTSLPGPYGVGDMGGEAIELLDRMAVAGLSWWQTLPLNPPAYGNSPHQCWSAFAGNPLLISPDLLIADGLLRTSDLAGIERIEESDHVDFDAAVRTKDAILRAAFERFEPDDDYRRFCEEERAWLDDAALFRGLSDHYEGRPWTEWDDGLRTRERESMIRAVEILGDAVEFQRFCQYVFFRQHARLKSEAAARGIRLMGDLPIFVAHNSADVWSHQELFRLDEEGEPTVVAGVPPDYFSKTGQRWGNPLYRWDVMAENDFRWWRDRLRSGLRLYDALRIDHFRGFQAYWEIPAEAKTAQGGVWREGPGADFFEAIRADMPDAQIIAEDLGVITPEVEELRDRFEFPGMKVLQFGVGDPESPHLPHNFETPHCVVYTGTHDNDTALGWWKSLPKEGRSFMRAYTGKSSLGRTRKRDAVEELIRLAFSSIAQLAIIPVQDLLGLGSESRMNVPGASGKRNWTWRMQGDALTDDLLKETAALVSIFGRGVPHSGSDQD